MSNKFRPKARLLQQIGDQLIRNEFVALHELIKNSYDAGSKSVTVSFEKTGYSDGAISVRDDGVGIVPDLVVARWLEIGTDNKKHLLDADQIDLPAGRKPLGEKGVGRFAAAKLGDYIEVITRAKDCSEVVMVLDWAEFLNKDYLDQISVSVKEREPVIFTGGQTGLLIKISKLRKIWKPSERKEVKLAALSMLSPFDTGKGFKIIVRSDVPGDFDDIPNLKELFDSALYTFDCTMEGDRITKFHYEFRPWTELGKIKGRSADESHPLAKQAGTLLWLNDENAKRRKVSEFKVLDLKSVGVGKLRFRGRIFNRSRKLLGLTNLNVDALIAFLNGNGGVRVFRDGVRVYDYGEPGNDWLDLGARRVNSPGVKLDSNLIIAAVEIDRAGSRKLIEKTNREGFIEGEPYDALKSAVLGALKLVEGFRREDQFSLMTYYGKGEPGAEPVIERIEELRDVIATANLESAVRKDVDGCIKKIEKEYLEMTSVLLTGAASGLHLSLVVHEIEKILKELKLVVRSEKTAERTKSIVARLNELVDKYSAILRGRIIKNESIAEVVRSAQFLSEYRFSAHGVEFASPDLEGVDIIINCDKNLLASALLNLIDNSLFWLGQSKVKVKKVFVGFKMAKGGLVITYCDSGTGYAISEKLLGRPFVSSKPGNSGIGLGLHIVKQIVDFHGGTVRFSSGSVFGLRGVYKEGAAVQIILPIKK